LANVSSVALTQVAAVAELGVNPAGSVTVDPGAKFVPRMVRVTPVDPPTVLVAVIPETEGSGLATVTLTALLSPTPLAPELTLTGYAVPAVEGAAPNVPVHWVDEAHVVVDAAAPWKNTWSVAVKPVPVTVTEKLGVVVSKTSGAVVTFVSVGLMTSVPVAVLGAGAPLVTVSEVEAATEGLVTPVRSNCVGDTVVVPPKLNPGGKATAAPARKPVPVMVTVVPVAVAPGFELVMPVTVMAG
jgi:hypothetical protein